MPGQNSNRSILILSLDGALAYSLPDSLHGFYSNPRIDLPKTQGNANFELPVTGTFVVDRNGIVAKAHVDADFTTRLEPSEVVAAVQQLS